MGDLNGKVALITGASRGIGRGIVLELASAGCDVILTARDAEVLQRVASEVRGLGRKAVVHAADPDGEFRAVWSDRSLDA